MNPLHTAKPLEQIPADLLADYTLNGRVAVENWYFDDSATSESPIFFSKDTIENWIKDADKRLTKAYGETDLLLYLAFERCSIKGKNVCVIGSGSAWFEAICFSFGANVSTVEYRPIQTDMPGLKVMTPEQYEQNPIKFDMAVSISSLEHDGLGRYGDPISPDADLVAMKKIKKMIAPGGLLFLAVPIGGDILVWNAHRVYGRVRLPLLFEGWEVVHTFGFTPEQLDRQTIGSGPERNYLQPVFVLKNL